MPRSFPHPRVLSLVLFSIPIALFVLLSSPLLAFAWETQINKVHDGDTIDVYRKGRDVDVRFYGIDCPEKDQPYGMKAKRYVSKMCNDRTVNVEVSGQDRYGRVIGLVYLDGKLLNEALIMHGLAWVYDRYCNKRICNKWDELEENARQSNVGLWSRSDPMPPWEWRHGGRSSRKRNQSQVKDRDCSDFSTQAEAQRFIQCVQKTADRYNVENIKTQIAVIIQKM